jgi:hypothetical protein
MLPHNKCESGGFTGRKAGRNSMTQLTPTESREIQSGSALVDILNCAATHALPPHQLLEPAIGTQEHAALVAAIRREFPEVYDPPAKRCKAD